MKKQLSGWSARFKKTVRYLRCQVPEPVCGDDMMAVEQAFCALAPLHRAEAELAARYNMTDLTQGA